LEDTGWDQRSGRAGQERQEQTARAIDPIFAVIAEHRDGLDHRHGRRSRYGSAFSTRSAAGNASMATSSRDEQVSMISYAER
jgi:hypothetical protein